MANNYMQFSEAINSLTEAETAWITEKLSQLDDQPDPSCPGLEDWQQEIAQFGWLSCRWQIERPDNLPVRLWLYDEESGNVENLVPFVQAFLTAFRPSDFFTLEWATWSSKPLLRGFSGGAVLITKDEAFWQTPDKFFEDKINQLQGKEVNTY